MAKPVTRGELREELARLEQKLDHKLDQKLKLWAGALDDRIERGERRMMAYISAKTTRQINAIWEATRAQIAVLDDKYKDLPRRVARLESWRKLKG